MRAISVAVNNSFPSLNSSLISLNIACVRLLASRHDRKIGRAKNTGGPPFFPCPDPRCFRSPTFSIASTDREPGMRTG